MRKISKIPALPKIQLYDTDKEGVNLVVKKTLVNEECIAKLKRIAQECNLTLSESKGYLWIQ